MKIIALIAVFGVVASASVSAETMNSRTAKPSSSSKSSDVVVSGCEGTDSEVVKTESKANEGVSQDFRKPTTTTPAAE